MRRALAMKKAHEQERPDMTPRGPTQLPSEHSPDRVPQNPREQGDTANILQNTTNRLLQR
jgi:hypothetical protein